MVAANAESHKVQEELASFKQTFELVKTELETCKALQGKEPAPKPFIGKLLNALARANVIFEAIQKQDQIPAVGSKRQRTD